jgi:hypothetical protein
MMARTSLKFHELEIVILAFVSVWRARVSWNSTCRSHRLPTLVSSSLPDTVAGAASRGILHIACSTGSLSFLGTRHWPHH